MLYLFALFPVTIGMMICDSFTENEDGSKKSFIRALPWKIGIVALFFAFVWLFWKWWHVQGQFVTWL